MGGFLSWLFSIGRPVEDRSEQRNWDHPRVPKPREDPPRPAPAASSPEQEIPKLVGVRYSLKGFEKIESNRSPGTFYYRNAMPALPRDQPGVKGDAFCRYSIPSARHHQDMLRIIVGGPYKHAVFLRCLVLISSEPDNPYDAGAMKVTMGGSTIGHIPRVDNVRFRAFLDGQGITGLVVCRAMIAAATEEAGGGVNLSLDLPDF